MTFELALPLEVAPRCYINAFPKSGTHLTELMVAGLLQPATTTKSIWCGTFKHHAWSTQWVNIDKPIGKLTDMPPTTYYKGHSGYTDEMAEILLSRHIATLFVYRDLRDVAVSAAFHALSDEERFVHDGKHIFQEMDSFEDVLAAVIVGTGVYAGLFDRWELYAKWLEQEWVTVLRYEDILAEPELVAGAVLTYITTMAGFELHPDDHAQLADKMALNTTQYRNVTYRNGSTGEWREHFTPRISKLFNERAGDWLARLGYEE